MMTEQQRKALSDVRARIAAAPHTYSQRDWGTLDTECRTPACIGGHMVAADAERHARVLAQPREHREGAVIDEAKHALGLERLPELFYASWPREWFAASGQLPRRAKRAVPSAGEAVAVLDAILDGRITDALAPREDSTW